MWYLSELTTELLCITREFTRKIIFFAAFRYQAKLYANFKGIAHLELNFLTALAPPSPKRGKSDSSIDIANNALRVCRFMHYSMIKISLWLDFSAI